MGTIISKSFSEPDEVISLPRIQGQIVAIGNSQIARTVHQPGWRWSVDVKPVVGTASCQHHHKGVVLSGQLHVVSDQGGERTIGPGEAFEIQPGHDGWVVGDEPCVLIEFQGFRDWTRSAVAGERVLATLLMTDIVDSTPMAAQLGDVAWMKLLARHFDGIREQLDRFRGVEVDTTGDGMLAAFDGAARAVRCALALQQLADTHGLRIRIGIHTGEIERHGAAIRGLAVHIAARISALAKAGEVLISNATEGMLEGSGLRCEYAGEHALKGIEQHRRLFRLV